MVPRLGTKAKEEETSARRLLSTQRNSNVGMRGSGRWGPAKGPHSLLGPQRDLSHKYHGPKGPFGLGRGTLCSSHATCSLIKALIQVKECTPGSRLPTPQSYVLCLVNHDRLGKYVSSLAFPFLFLLFDVACDSLPLNLGLTRCFLNECWHWRFWRMDTSL